MGTLVQVEDPRQLAAALRTVRLRRGDLAIALGTSDDEIAIPVGWAELRIMNNPERIPGVAWKDYEPVEFDDLIEVRTGGDRAIGVVLEPHEDDEVQALTVGMWPLRIVDSEVYLTEQLRPLLDGVEGEPHTVIARPGSVIEDVLAMDWGYRPLQPWSGTMRRYCPDRFWAVMRADMLALIESRRQQPPERNDFPRYANTGTTANHRISYTDLADQEFTLTSSSLWSNDQYQIRARAQRVSLNPLNTDWSITDEDDAEYEPDVEPDVEAADDDYDYDEEDEG